MLLGLDLIDQADNTFRRALNIRTDYPEAFVGLARVQREMQDYDEAHYFINKALSIDPQMIEAKTLQGSIYLEEGKTEVAEEHFLAILEVDADNESAKLGLGSVYLEQGKLEQSREIFSKVVEEGGDSAGALFSLVQSQKMKKDNALTEVLFEKEKELDEIPDKHKMHMLFALGKLYDDLKEPEKAFPYFIEACKMKRKKIEYDADPKERHFALIRTTFSKEFIEQGKQSAIEDNTPIFVLGMPRSGTTLTEQIIASHPDVYGAGELNELLELAGWRNNDNLSK